MIYFRATVAQSTVLGLAGLFAALQQLTPAKARIRLEKAGLKRENKSAALVGPLAFYNTLNLVPLWADHLF